MFIDVHWRIYNTQTQGEDAVLATAHVYGTKLGIITLIFWVVDYLGAGTIKNHVEYAPQGDKKSEYHQYSRLNKSEDTKYLKIQTSF